jgi:hypothetical protein
LPRRHDESAQQMGGGVEFSHVFFGMFGAIQFTWSLNFSERKIGLTRKLTVYYGMIYRLSFASSFVATKEEFKPLQHTNGDFHEA